MAEPTSPFFESTVYKAYALTTNKKLLRLEGSKLTYRKEEGDKEEEGKMRLTSASKVVATQNLPRRRKGFKVTTGRKTWCFEVRQNDKYAQLWVEQIQEAINRLMARERDHQAHGVQKTVVEEQPGKVLIRRGSKLKAPKATYSLTVDAASYTLPIRKIRATQVDTKNWGRATFNLDERYVKTGYLGEGSYGVVIAADDKTDKDTKVAVKGLIGLFNGTNTHLDPIRKIAREVRVSRQVDHPHVIKLIDAYVPPSPDFDHVYLIFEHMEKSLWKVGYGKYDLTPVQVQWLMYQLVCGLHYLHSMGVMHRDLAPTNILVNKNLELKICDLGFARTTAPLGPHDVNLSREAVTQYWRAPEVELSVGGYTQALDIWAAGVIFGDLLTRKPLLASKSVTELLTKQVALVGKPDDATIERIATQRCNRQNKQFLLRMEPPATPPNLAKLFPPAKDAQEASLWAAGLDLIQKMLVFDPAERISAAEAMRHPFFDEHFPEMGPRTPEAEKPAGFLAEWGDIDSDEFTTLDTNARKACRRWILEDLVAIYRESLRGEQDESDDEGDEEIMPPEPTAAGRVIQSSDSSSRDGSSTAPPTAEEPALAGGQAAENDRRRQSATNNLWSWLGYLVA